MILPNNGRVILIDDESTQALPLISALSKHNVATSYYNATPETIPIKPIDDARILFLDINLIGKQQPDWNSEKAMLISCITGILAPKIPYILFVWSVNEKEHLADLIKLFDEELIDYKPIVPLISMEKSSVFKLEVVEEKLVWSLTDTIDNTIESIRHQIEVGISTIDSVEALIKWENIVARSTTEVTNEIASLAGNNPNTNETLKNIYFKLAEAMWGRQLNADAKEITTKAVSIFNQLLVDRLEFNVYKYLEINLISEISPPVKFEERDKALFNSKLLLNFHDRPGAFPGNVYEVETAHAERYPTKSLLGDSINVPLVSEEFYLTTPRSSTYTPEDVRIYKSSHSGDYKRFEKNIREQIKAKSKFISIEVSPICDYAQKKWKTNRICPAILWHNDFEKYIGKFDSHYISPVLLVGSECFNIVIDLRYFSSQELTTLQATKPIFGLKHSFLTDIQSLLSRHVSRPGITSLS